MKKPRKTPVKKAVRGRPPLAEGKRSGVFQMRLTDEEKARWMEKAAAAGLTLAEWFRWMADRAK